MQAFERFRDEKILPQTQAAGLGAPSVQVVEVDELMRGGGEDPAFAQCVRIDNLDAGSFAEMDRRILPEGDRPEEVVWHVHGPIGQDWCVIDTWTSRAARDQFIRQRVMPAMQEAGVAGPPAMDELDVEASMGEGARAVA